MTQLTAHDDASARAHEATPQRLLDARRQGKVARSGDLTAAVVLLTGVALVGWLGPHLLAGLRDMTASLLDGRSEPLASPTMLGEAVRHAIGGVLLPLAGVVFGVLIAALAVGMLQAGALRSTEPLKPRWARLSPLAGVKRIASRRTAVRLGFTLAKLTLAAVIIATTIQAYWQRLLRIGTNDIDALGAAARSAIGRATLQLGLGLLALALLDWLYQRWQHRQDLKMTHQQWRDELRRSEGDPAIRRKQRRGMNDVRGTAPTAPHPNDHGGHLPRTGSIEAASPVEGAEA